MLPPSLLPCLLLGLSLHAAPPTSPVPAARVDALLSRDEATWREAALDLSFAGPEAVRAVAARGEKLGASHRAVQTFLMLTLLQSATPQDLRALPALANFWEPAVAEARQWRLRPIAFARPGPSAKPPGRTLQETPEQQEAAKNLRALKRMQAFLVPFFLERLASPEPDAALDAVLALERLEAWSAHAEVEKLASDPKRGTDDVAAKSARRYLESWRKAAQAPNAAALLRKPRLAAMVAFEEAAEPDMLWKGLQQAAPGALEAKTGEAFWSAARPAFAAFWRAAAGPAEGRAAALALWSDRNRGYSLAFSAGPAPQRLRLAGPAGASAVVTELASGKALGQGRSPSRWRASLRPGAGWPRSCRGGRSSWRSPPARAGRWPWSSWRRTGEPGGASHLAAGAGRLFDLAHRRP